MSTIHIGQVWYFAIWTGVPSVLAFDLWCLLTRTMGIVVVEWGLLGRWAIGLFRGKVSICDSCHHVRKNGGDIRPAGFALRLLCHQGKCDDFARLTRGELLLGWCLHYTIAIGWVLMVPLIWGWGYLRAPTLIPALLVGFVLSSLVGYLVTLPALKLGKINHGRHTLQVNILMLAGNAVFAMAIYGFSCLYVRLGL